MTFVHPLRRFVLTAHITFAVGWVGAAAGFLALAITGLRSQDAQIMNSAYIGMDLIARFVILPLSFAPLITGPILSLGTPWGLFRHYWILAKLLITILSTIIMLVHMQPISHLSHVAADEAVSTVEPSLRIQMVAASSVAVIALLAVTALAVYKPRGMTPYGWREQYKERIGSPDV